MHPLWPESCAMRAEEEALLKTLRIFARKEATFRSIHWQSNMARCEIPKLHWRFLCYWRVCKRIKTCIALHDLQLLQYILKQRQPVQDSLFKLHVSWSVGVIVCANSCCFRLGFIASGCFWMGRAWKQMSFSRSWAKGNQPLSPNTWCLDESCGFHNRQASSGQAARALHLHGNDR